MSSRKKKSVSSSQSGRLFKLGSALVKAGAHYAVDSLKTKKEELWSEAQSLKEGAGKLMAAREIITSMGELKGAVMKLGQMLSITEDLVLPKEISSLFKSLQNTAPPMPDEDIDEVFLKSFGKRPEDLFAYFDRVPLAQASIGQVHKGCLLDGREVAIKIQYPKVAQAIKSDLKNIHQLEKLFALVFPTKLDIKEHISELKKNLLEECDYQREMGQMAEFRQLFAQEFPQIKIPLAYPEYSSSQILTMELVQGERFEETLNYTQEQRNFLGESLYQSFLYCLFQKRKLHTDPQNGNYLFRPDQIIILDFGSTRGFSQEFVNSYAKLLLAVQSEDLELYQKATQALGLTGEGSSEEYLRKHFALVKAVYGPYLQAGKYKVADLNPFKNMKEFFSTVPKDQLIAPRREFLLLDRANLGLFTKLKDWEAEVDWEKGRERFLYPLHKRRLSK